MNLGDALDVLKTAHDCHSGHPDTRPVRVIRVLRVLRVARDRTMVRARVLCRDYKVRDVTGTVMQITDPADTFGTFEIGA